MFTFGDYATVTTAALIKPNKCYLSVTKKKKKKN